MRTGSFEGLEGPIIHVLIGQVHVVRSAHVLFAVLGSCVGVALCDRVSHLSGMAHILLPESRGQVEPLMPGKYADQAIDCLIDSLLELGAMPGRLEACLAGGAALCSLGDAQAQVGQANVEAANRHLRRRQVPVREKHLGGVLGRKVALQTHSGTFSVQLLAAATRDGDLRSARP